MAGRGGIVGLAGMMGRVPSHAQHQALASSYSAVYRHFSSLARRQEPILRAQAPPRSHNPLALEITARRRAFATTPSPLDQSRQPTGAPSSPSGQSPDPSSSDGHEPNKTQEVIRTYLPSIRRLAAKLPNLRSPPTPAELLPLARSSWHRLQIRFKWLTIRSFRPFRTDDYSAFASVVILLNLILLALGTTTFIGVVLFIFNKAGMEDFVARWLSDYMTGSTGVHVVFESAVVPRWRDGMIRFENVYVSRGDLAANAQALMTVVDGPGTKGDGKRSRMEEALEVEGSQQTSETGIPHTPPNVTHFHLSIASIDVTLSLRRWLDGQGLIRDAVVKGTRGVVDRSHIEPVEPPPDRASLRRQASVGDFHLESLQVEDLLVTIYQPNDFRPVRRGCHSAILSPSADPETLVDVQYTFSIFNADVRRLRKQWLFLDLLSAEKVTGQVDNCLFSLHRPQSISRSAFLPVEHHLLPTEATDRFDVRLSRFRIDGVPIDHLQTPRDTGALAWIVSGKADLVADIRLPMERNDVDIGRVVREIVDNFEREVGSPGIGQRDGRRGDQGFGFGLGELIGGRISERPALARPALEAPRTDSATPVVDTAEQEEPVKVPQRVVIDMDIRFKDVKAHLPVRRCYTLRLVIRHNTELVADVHDGPVVRQQRSGPPDRRLYQCQSDPDPDPSTSRARPRKQSCLVALNRAELDCCKSQKEFDGSWTTFDVGLIEVTSEQVGRSSLLRGASLTHDLRRSTKLLLTMSPLRRRSRSGFRRSDCGECSSLQTPSWRH